MLVGRASEQRAITGVLDAARTGVGSGLLIRGDPGSGKSTLLHAARVQARTDGFTVLSSRGRAADTDVAYAGLAELLRPLEPRFGALPDPLGPAIAAAVGVEAGRTRATDVGWATYRLLVAEAERAPLLLLIDDVAWLDSASWQAMSFAGSRMSGDAVAVVAATRHGTSGPVIDDDGFTLLELGGLDDDELADLVDPDGELADGVLAGCRRRTGGNPLATIELIGSLDGEQRAGRTALPPIPRPGDAIARGFGWRLDRLGGAARRALVVAAADDTGDLGVVSPALRILGEDPGSLDEAESARIIEIDDGRIRFAHPLLRAVAYHQVERSSRRTAHQALAAVLDQPPQAEARAWHLAAAADGADERAASALDLVASRAAARGAATEAARTYERAAALSPSTVDRARRTLCGGRAWLAAGRPERTQSLLVAQAAGLDDGVEGVALTLAILLSTAAELLDGPIAAGSIASDAAARTGATDTEAAPRVLCAVAADHLQRGGNHNRARVLARSLLPGDDWSAAMARSVNGDHVDGERATPPALVVADLLDRRLARRRAERLLVDGHPEAARAEVLDLVQAGDPLDVGVLDLAACAARALDRLGHRADARAELGAVVDAASAAPANSRPMAESLLAELQLPAEGTSGSPVAPSPLDDLTPAERRVAIAVGEGRTNKESAEVLYLSVKTVDYHLQGIYRKLRLRSRAELAVLVTREEVRSE